jgi:hypothetical protein
MEAMKATYERAMRDKNTRDELVKPHDLDAGQWVLVRHENPQKFESKWYGPYQIVERMMLGTYRLQDPSGKELAALVHGNRLVPAAIRNAEELRELWASPKTKDALRRQNVRAELVLADEENTRALEQHLLEADAEEPPLLQDTAPKGPSQNQSQDQRVAPQQTQSGSKPRFILRIPVKRTHEQAAMAEALKRPRT